MRIPVSKFDWIKNSKSLLPKGDWFVEFFTPGELHAHKAVKVLETSKTYFQSATLIKTHTFGKVLVIDSETQSSEFDEAFYHESLTTPALLMHRKPETALILGGGEGATARDILNSRTIKSVVMADIDYAILEFAKKHMSAWHRGAFKDDRLTLLVQDAGEFVERTERKFDLVYSDLPCPIEGGPAFQLYTLEFYRKLKTILRPGGIFAMQAGPGTPLQFELHPAIRNTLSRVFRFVRSYSAYIPSYDMPWTYLYCTDSPASVPERFSAADLDSAIKRTLRTRLRFSDGATVLGAFTMPKYYRDLMAARKDFITAGRPMFFTTSQH
ncbi:MAG: fused MFS/spermidine synthase [Elusimicrobiales bacterium]|jgi:spermidine synthase